MLVEGRAGASMRMPHQPEKPLQPEDIEILLRWIDQGARDAGQRRGIDSRDPPAPAPLPCFSASAAAGSQCPFTQINV